MNDAQIQNGLRRSSTCWIHARTAVNFYNQVLHGDLGVSNITNMNVPITQIVAEKRLFPSDGRYGAGISLFVFRPAGAHMARGKESG